MSTEIWTIVRSNTPGGLGIVAWYLDFVQIGSESIVVKPKTSQSPFDHSFKSLYAIIHGKSFGQLCTCCLPQRISYYQSLRTIRYPLQLVIHRINDFLSGRQYSISIESPINSRSSLLVYKRHWHYIKWVYCERQALLPAGILKRRSYWHIDLQQYETIFVFLMQGCESIGSVVGVFAFCFY